MGVNTEKTPKDKLGELKPMVIKAIRFYEDILNGEGLRPYQEKEYIDLKNWSIENFSL